MTTDTTTLDMAPEAVRTAHRTGARLYLVTTYPGGSTYHRTGRIGRTTGTRPTYLVMHRSSNYGSSDILTEHDWEGDTPRTRVVATQRDNGRYYDVRGNVVKPGRNRYEEA